jgi:hypothetical protein
MNKNFLTRALIATALLVATALTNAQMPAALRDANGPAAGDWAKAGPILRNAIECRTPLRPSGPVQAVFGLTNASPNGDHRLPDSLTVFGSLKVTAISIFQGSEDEGSSYTVQLVGMKLAEVAKAARLKRDGARFVRVVKGGLIEASEPQPGIVKLSCIQGGNQD